MNLSKIYASKIYLTSTRQDKIHAAINDPINVELVQQVAEYLDDDSKQELKQAIKEKEAKEAPKDTTTNVPKGNVFDEYENSKPSGSFSGGAPSHSAPHSGNVFDDFDSMSDTDMGDIPEGESIDTSDIPSDIPAPEPSADIEESTEVVADDGIEVVSSEEEQPAIQSGIIKKLLNDQDDTKGAVRVDPTDDEVWIYYEDKINLNDVMDNVITVIKDTYNTLKFSRLARTDNAIVFDIKE